MDEETNYPGLLDQDAGGEGEKNTVYVLPCLPAEKAQFFTQQELRQLKTMTRNGEVAKATFIARYRIAAREEDNE